LQWYEDPVGNTRWSQVLREYYNTPQEERDRRAAESKRRHHEELARVTELHERVLAALPEPLLDVAKLHEPHVYETYAHPECCGCDPGSYAEDSPGWPCTTYELLMKKAGVTDD
jgi:hypothetical protein